MHWGDWRAPAALGGGTGMRDRPTGTQRSSPCCSILQSLLLHPLPKQLPELLRPQRSASPINHPLLSVSAQELNPFVTAARSQPPHSPVLVLRGGCSRRPHGLSAPTSSAPHALSCLWLLRNVPGHAQSDSSWSPPPQPHPRLGTPAPAVVRQPLSPALAAAAGLGQAETTPLLSQNPPADANEPLTSSLSQC